MILATILIYFCILLIFSKITSHKANNETFYRGNRRSPWYMVAFGMVGASISGITFVSVPGMAYKMNMTYLQMCIGFIFGYFIVAFFLLPVYYKHNLTTIYSYLKDRMGNHSYKTGASFFIISKIIGAAVRFYVVCIILQKFVLDNLGIPFILTVPVMVMLIWFYTRKGGIKTLVWTDTFQTLCMFSALILIIYYTIKCLDFTPMEAYHAICDSKYSQIFVFDDWISRQNFWKQFLSGIFVVIVMTGLDQDMMQKNLTCKNLRAAQKDMCSYGVLFVPVNFLFLALGVLLLLLYQKTGVPVPEKGDDLLSGMVLNGMMGNVCLVFFTIGVIASAFSSADSAMTALTTSFCIDILEKEEDEKTRKRVHLGVMVAFVLVTLVFNAIGSGSVMDLIYTLVSYTYGPLLGLFAFGMFTRRQPQEKYVPFIAIASPLICYMIDVVVLQWTGYQFGYELLMFNGLLTFVGLWGVSHRYSQKITGGTR